MSIHYHFYRDVYHLMSLSENISPDELKILIHNCERGHRQSQSRLYELFAPKMFVLCLRYSRNREEAEESLQEGFVRVFECIHQFRFNGSFEGG